MVPSRVARSRSAGTSDQLMMRTLDSRQRGLERSRPSTIAPGDYGKVQVQQTQIRHFMSDVGFQVFDQSNRLLAIAARHHDVAEDEIRRIGQSRPRRFFTIRRG